MSVSVLFVCLGNICRSPTAEAVFRQRVIDAGLQERIRIDSAGTGDWHIGKAPDRRASAAAAGRGYAMDDLRARQVSGDDFRHFDYVLAMDDSNLADLETLRAGVGADDGVVLARFLDVLGEDGPGGAGPVLRRRRRLRPCAQPGGEGQRPVAGTSAGAAVIERDADLSGANTLALPARAERLARPDSEAALAEALATRGAGEPLFVLGQGSNIVLDGDLPGLTLIPSLTGVDYQEQGGDTARVTVGAGVVWDTLVADTVARGWRGLENLSLIPGTAGAAPFQNIGAYGVELADVLDSVDTLAVADGRPVRFAAADCEFDYRDSLFKSRRRGEFIITGITLTLRRHGPAGWTTAAWRRASPMPTRRVWTRPRCARR